MPVTAYSYVRFSSKKQESGDSIRRQSEAFFEYCKTNKYNPVELKIDRGLSARDGTNIRKGSLGAFIALIKSGQIQKGSILVVESLDRLSRQETVDGLDLFLTVVRAGVEIHTLVPSAIYNRTTIRQAGTLHVVIAFFERAFNESETKSYRAREAVERRLKETRANGTPNHNTPPGWIDLVGGKYKLNKHADTVKQIIQWGIDGLGPVAITKRLNKSNTPTMSRKGKDVWNQTTIKMIFDTKRVLGYYQPTTVEDHKRKPTGEPIKVYPPVITEDQYYQLQNSLNNRRANAKGRQSDTVANLFGKLLVSGQDNTTMLLVAKGTGKVNMISRGAREGKAAYNSFDYKSFESAFLMWVREVKIDQHQQKQNTSVQEGKLVAIRKKIATLKKTLATGGDFEHGLELLRGLGETEKALVAEIDQIKSTNTSNVDTDSTAKLIDQLKNTTGDELQELRAKIRVAISAIVKRINVYVYGGQFRRICFAHVQLANGVWRVFAVTYERGKGMETNFSWVVDGEWPIEAFDRWGAQWVAGEIGEDEEPIVTFGK